jgi:aspartate/methionine/tyrosine aminotransferase
MPSSFQPFLMERMMSKWENVVEYNLSESGVHPLAAGELLNEPALVEELLSTRLGYVQANGTIELRERIAALYPGATADNVLVTVGCAEANLISVLTVMEPGDELVMMLPNYMQIWGIAHNFGFRLKAFNLREGQGWAPDLDELHDVISDKTRLVAICNPNNPTGYILTAAEMEAIVAAAAKVGAWLLADEVYSGAERLTDAQTPSFWGRYDRVLANNSVSKAYGIPGLRIGWVIGPADMVDQIWARHEYTTISAATLANKLTALALSPQVRPRILARTREHIRRGFPILGDWLEEHAGILTMIPPQAAAIAFLRYNLEVNSTEFVGRLRREKSVLVVPGDHFGHDYHLRVSFGLPPEFLRVGLERIGELVVELQQGS